MTDKGYSFKKSYRLAAQTPMIHFQWNQQGATLRASEVKPKLDKFLITKLEGFEKVLEEKENWLLGYPLKYKSEYRAALNYKLYITADKVQVEEPPKFGLYYGNMGVYDEEKKAKFIIGDCNLTVNCLSPDLLNFIDKNIREFFVIYNFGRMNDKGFGSFVIDGHYSDKEIGEVLCGNYGGTHLYWFDCKNGGDLMRKDVFDSIKTLYSVMKSGYNINGKYHRSFLFDYFHKMNIGNEKAHLKKEKMSPYNDGKPVEYPNSNRRYSDMESDEYMYVRALLGVGERIEYIIGFNWNNDKNRYLPEREKLQVSIKSDYIERFPSPVFFKIIGNKVYFVAKRTSEEILDKEFEFSIKNNRKIDYGKIEVDPNKKVVLKTPKSFDVDEFLDFFYNNYDETAPGYGIRSKINQIEIGGEINE